MGAEIHLDLLATDHLTRSSRRLELRLATSVVVLLEARARDQKKPVEPVVLPLSAAEDIDAPAFEAPPLAETTSTQPSRDFSAQLQVEKLEDGSLRIAAPPHLAEPLAALLDQLARGLRSDTSAIA